MSGALGTEVEDGMIVSADAGNDGVTLTMVEDVDGITIAGTVDGAGTTVADVVEGAIVVDATGDLGRSVGTGALFDLAEGLVIAKNGPSKSSSPYNG